VNAAARRIIPVIIALGVAIGLVWLYRAHIREVTLEAERDEPVVAPSRVVEAGQGAALVAFDSAERRRVGLAVDLLSAASRAPADRLPGEVAAENGRSAVLRAPVSGRLSVPPSAHWPSLGDRVAAGAVLAQVSDARPLSLPIGGVVTRVGAQPGALVEAGQSLLEIADYSRPLVRIAWPDRAGDLPPPRLTLGPLGEQTRVDARLVGPAAEADPVTRRPVYLYRAERGWPGALPGTPVLLLVPRAGKAAAGVLVPDSAVVQWEGLAWAYRQRGVGRYERVRVSTERPAPGGWITGEPLEAGDTVVVRGAQELLSEEFRARVTVGDEAGE
jgi:biotin carboxyl carrier protein